MAMWYKRTMVVALIIDNIKPKIKSISAISWMFKVDRVAASEYYQFM